jgi:hypothetical protein
MSYIIKGADDKPILHQGKEIHAMDFMGVVRGVDLETRSLKMIGTDETRDRDGDIVKVAGWMLENYQKNPVFLWAHDYRSVPLAAAQKVIRKRNPASLEFQMRFPTEGLHPFADMILNLYSEGIINASSVGFIPFKWEDLSDEEKQDMSPMAEMWGGKKFTKQELLELSGCAVPSNPNALQNSLAAKGFGEKYHLELDELARFIMRSGGHSPIEILGAKSDDVYQELKLDKCAFEDETEPKVHPVPVQLDGVDAKAKLEGAATGDPEVKAPEAEPKVFFNPVILSKLTEFIGGKDGEARLTIIPSSCGKGVAVTDLIIQSSAEEVEKYLREHYSKKFGVDVSEKDFTIIRTEFIDVVGSGIPVGHDGKHIKTFTQMNKGIMQVTKEEVIDSKDLEPGGKAGPVLSRKNRETLLQARDVLDELLKEVDASEAGEEDPSKSGAGDTTAEKTLQEELEKIKNIIYGINKSFGG